MRKKRKIAVTSMFLFILLFAALLLFFAISNPDLGITITKPLNQSYNYINHTINVTTSTTASSCRYILGGATQGNVWEQLSSPGWASGFLAARYSMGAAVSPNGTIWLVGGRDFSSNNYNDVWYSPDGNTWAEATSSAQWSQRYGHSLVVRSDGSLWIYGGYDNSGNYYNDVWNSTDSVTWTLVNSSAAWENRSWGVGLITSDDVMWMLGGKNSSSEDAFRGDVWNSSNGIDWTLVNESAFAPRKDFAAVVGDNDRIWVFGGTNETFTYNDIWYSDDKINWFAGNATEVPWSARYGMSVTYTPSDKRIWILGGYDPDYLGTRNDVWYSQDGGNWTQAASTSSWTAREWHSTVTTPNGTIFLMGGVGPGWVSDQLWKSAPPITMDPGVPNGVIPWGREFYATEGGNFVGVECNDTSNIWNGTNVSFYVDTVLPVLTISNPLNTTYNGTSIPVAANVTVSETASHCNYSLNSAATVTMDGSSTEWGKEFTAAEGSNTIVVSCNDTVNNWNSTSITFFLDSIKPVINITRPFNITYTYTNHTVNATTNESASICMYALNTNGIDENWTTLNSSAFIGRYGHSLINTSDGTMWIIGGAVGAGIVSYLNDVWNSTDGINWVQVTASAAFSARAYHTSLVDSTGKMWVIAGYDGTNILNDTWYSTDGITWTQANASAFPARYGHSSVVDNDGKMWVIAGLIPGAGLDPPILSGEFSISKGEMGGTPVTTNTTWYSTDGYAWIQANASAFPSRYLHTSVVSSDGKIWVIGGYYTLGTPEGDIAYSDVWYSNDSASWARATDSAAFGERYRHASAATPDNRIWLLGGQDSGSNEYNDVWYSTNGSGWKLANSTSAWSARSQHSAMYLNNAIYLIGGRDVYTQGLNDTYKTTIPADYYDMDGSGTEWGKSFIALTGSNDIKVRCWDIAGNLNSSMQWFTVNLCGNNVCDTEETTASCPADCPAEAAQTSTGSSSSASTGGGASTKTITDFNNLKAGIETEKKLIDLKTSLTKIAITSKNDIASLTMSIEKIGNIPDYAENLQGKIYEILDIKLDKEVELKAKICFSVEEQWISEQEMQKEDIVLAHYNPKVIYKLNPGTISEKEMTLNFATEERDWEELPTQIVKSEETKTEYCSEAKAFSPYAIIAKKPEIEEFLTVIKPTIETQIITANAVKLPKQTDWRALREWIMGSIDAILLLILFTIIMFGDRIFPEGINIPLPNIHLPSLPKIQMPSIETMPPAPKPSELKLPEIPLFPAELPKAPAIHELPAEYKRILFAFARDSLLKGYSESEIRKEMSNHYIAGESIDSIISQCRSKICAMTRYELLPHVIDLVMRGYSVEYISKAYAKNEISSHCIESVIKLARREISAASRKSLLPFTKKCLLKRMPAFEIINLLVKHGVNKTAAEELVSRAHSLMKKQRHLK